MMKFRNLEVAACGSVALQEQHPDIDRQLTPFEDYWPYRDADDAIGQIRKALADPDRLARIGRQAARRIRDDYTWSALWPRIEAALSLRGFPASPWQSAPDADGLAQLATTTLGMAHACEAKSYLAAAESFYREVLSDLPQERTAWAGLARLAEQRQAPPETVSEAWQHAKGSGPARSYNLEYGPMLGLPGLGRRFYSDPTADAALWLFRLKGSLGDFTGAAEVAAAFAPHFDTVLHGQARLWAQMGQVEAALRLYDTLIALHPDRLEWQQEADRLR
jgi:tetratricopeptide (TPR) repeat protein